MEKKIRKLSKTVDTPEGKFRVVIDKDKNIATAKKVAKIKTICTEELGDNIVFYFEKETNKLVGFTILHLMEFQKEMRRRKENHIESIKARAREELFKNLDRIFGKNHDIASISFLPHVVWNRKRFEDYCI